MHTYLYVGMCTHCSGWHGKGSLFCIRPFHADVTAPLHAQEAWPEVFHSAILGRSRQNDNTKSALLEGAATISTRP